MTDIEMKDASKEPEEEKKDVKEPDDLFFGKSTTNLLVLIGNTFRIKEKLGFVGKSFSRP